MRFDILPCSADCSPFKHVHFRDLKLNARYGPTNSVEEAKLLLGHFERSGDLSKEGSKNLLRQLREKCGIPLEVEEWYGMRREGWALKALMDGSGMRIELVPHGTKIGYG